ncbi:hypothetical protein BKA70DRAFT_1090072, partial [Coprinopsis sp. MPI-PUGE-AT-0042]
TFGRDVICKFSSGVSEGKCRAAPHFEDLLQCAMLAVENLLPEPHNKIVQKLLYLCAQWHALAKLCLHNNLTLWKLENSTILMTDQFCVFVCDTCSNIVTYKLKAEQDACNRQASCEKTKGKQPGKAACGKQRKHFNIETSKFHAVGNYVDNIQLFGTTDSYSTEVVSCLQSCPKSTKLNPSLLG